MPEKSERRIGVLASGAGSTFEAVHKAIETDKLANVAIAFVICNNGPTNPDALVWEKARRLGVNIFHVSNRTQEKCTLQMVNGVPGTESISYEASDRIFELATSYKVDLIAGLGFMKRVIGKTLAEIPIANAHPGPLPITAGQHGAGVQEVIMKNHCNFSGPTLHWMDTELNADGLPAYDVGAVIGHEPVAITDTMRAEWQDGRSVEILRQEVMRVEKDRIPGWINLALEQLTS